MGSDFIFNGFQIIFCVILVMVFGVFVFTVVRGIAQWSKNKRAPRLTVDATVVSKREDISFHHHENAGDMSGAHGYHTTSSTSYYATFQVSSGDRMELNVGREYGMLAKGDRGMLTFQGSRYLSFQRI